MVEIFKTDISTEKEAKKVKRKLENLFPDYKINFDLEDCDNILRLENNYIDISIVISVLTEHKIEWLDG